MPMSDLRENFGWLVGSIATAIAMAFGWLISSDVVVSLLFLLIGSAITYFVQSRTQKRAFPLEGWAGLRSLPELSCSWLRRRQATSRGWPCR